MKKDSSVAKLANSIDEAGLKITFGIQPSHIEIIEAELKRWDEMEISGEKHPGLMLYSEYFWEVIGKKVGWLPFTICLYYFKYKANHSQLIKTAK